MSARNNPTDGYRRLVLAAVGQAGVDFQSGDLSAGRWLLHDGADLLSWAEQAETIDETAWQRWISSGCPGAERFRGGHGRAVTNGRDN